MAFRVASASRSNSDPAAGGLVMITLFFAVLAIGLAIGADAWPIGVAVLGVAIIIPATFLLAEKWNQPIWDVIFWMIASATVVLPIIHKITGWSLYFVLELLLIFTAPALALNVGKFLRELPAWRWLVTFLAAFVVISILSSIFGRSTPLAGVYQFLTNFKFLFILLLGFALAWTTTSEKYHWSAIKWFWLPQAVLMFWQWGHQSSYFAVFSGVDYISSDPFGTLPSRGLGTFQHPSFLAAFASFFGLASWVRWLFKRETAYLLLSCIYLFVLLGTTERQEILAFIVLIGTSVVLIARPHSRVLVVVGTAGAIGILGYAIWPHISDNFIREFTQWGIIGSQRIEHPRAVIYITAVRLANDHFPLGSGLGTFGSAGAMIFDRSLYFELGFQSYWWFLKKNFLMDTYWPNFVAETGWIGALFMLCSFACLGKLSINCVTKSVTPDQRIFATLALMGMGFMLMLSLSSPAFQDPSLFLIPGVWIGIAHRMLDDCRVRAATRYGDQHNRSRRVRHAAWWKR